MLGITLRPAWPAGAGDPGCSRSRHPRPVAVGDLFEAAAVAGDGRDRVGHVEQLPAGRHPVLRAARRDPAALGHGRAHVQRAGAVGAVAARRADAFQHRGLRDVRGDLRLERRHGGDDRHRRPGRGREARLFRAAVPRHDRRRRHARHPHPALDQHDRLWRAHRDLDPQALSRGLHPRPRARDPVQPDRAGHLPDQAIDGRHADLDELGAALRSPARPDPAAGDLPGGDRLDLCRLGDGDGVRGARRARRRRHCRGTR